MQENIDTEFKELDRIKGTLPESLSKTIIAFANTAGGKIFIGIRDDGSVAGVDEPDDIMNRISNIAHDTILPDIIPFIQIRTIDLEGKQVIRIDVAVGTERPYYLSKDGLKPKGVYVRRGSACIPVNEAGIREMIRETSGKSFEESRSLNQELTFETLQNEMKVRNLEFGAPQMKTLKLTGSDGLYTNLALLLSDQCPHTIKVAIFQGEDNSVFRARKEFSGSLLKQLNEAYQFLDFYNETKADFSGLLRYDQRDYPEDAVREALLNSIIHRDYLFSGSTIINIFKNHMEFISLGGLVRGISMDAIFLGVSQSRNPNLANIFYRMGLIESYGTGVRKILRLYKDSMPSPSFRTAEGVFAVELPNSNEAVPTREPVVSESTRGTTYQTNTASRSASYKISDRKTIGDRLKDSICKLANEKGRITRKDVEDAFGFGSTKAFKYLKILCAEGKIRQQKNGNQTTYVPA
ncbi:MAG: putative DNA binding domain-containing protein [Acidaminococcaceae bacterium]|nr:putative DNA binding domain-containing protein [Acidaminococcaceae bacterium]